ncbi:hypothetical protein MBLNU457_3094t1 [Dothideomycetes sp. NU457]
MDSYGRWKPLRLKQESVPVLFACHEFAASRYGIVLTDLTNVWEETLDVGSICDRAERDGCAISPREDQQQLNVFFRKLADALDGLQTTSMTLRSDDRKENLIIQVSAPLPAPLPPFNWRVNLRKKDSRALTRDVVCPLLLNLHQKQQIIEQLSNQLREKDHVISRLLDRFESSSTDLREVFPGTSSLRISKKTSQRSQLARHVNGLAPFEKTSLQYVADNAPATKSLLDVVEATQGRHLQDLWRTLGEHPQQWWSTIGTLGSQRAKSLETLSSRRTSSGQDDDTAGETEDEEEFQVQELPRRSDAAPGEVSNADDPVRSSSIASREMSVADVMRSSPPIPALDRYTPPSLPPSETNTPKRLGRIASQGAGNTTGSSQTTPSKTRASQRLGVIGGRKTQSQVQPLDPIPSIETEDEKEQPQTQTGRRGLQSGQKSNLPEAATPARGRSAKVKEPLEEIPELPKETSQERADRRREELKHQLAVQASGEPKKKRKF